MYISRTPYRFSFYGGALDYKDWYIDNPTRILCAGLDYYCYQSVRVIPSFFDYKYRICYSKVETAKTLNEISHPSAREILRKHAGDKSIEISYTGDLPARSGIGSSSAFSIGLLNCMNVINNNFVGRTELALEAINIEQNVINEIVGIQDQCASAFGGIVIIEADKQLIRPRRFIANPAYIEYIQDNLLMGFDGVSRSSQVAAKSIKSSIIDKRKAELLSELSFLSNEGVDLFVKESTIDKHAEITKNIRNIKMILNGDNKINKIQEIIEKTEALGSLCTRFMGAGGGGFFMCWAPKYTHKDIKNSLNIKTWVDVKFSRNGSQLIFAES